MSEQYKQIDDFFYRIRENIVDLIESKNNLNKQNLTKHEFSALHNLMEKKNDKFIVNDSDKI